MVCFFFKQKTAYEMRISDWSSDVCSSDLAPRPRLRSRAGAGEWCRDRPPFVLRRSETFLNKMCLPGLAGSICQGRSVPVSIKAMTRKLFGTDGIRGTANAEPMTAETALKVAMAAATQ